MDISGFHRSSKCKSTSQNVTKDTNQSAFLTKSESRPSGQVDAYFRSQHCRPSSCDLCHSWFSLLQFEIVTLGFRALGGQLVLSGHPQRCSFSRSMAYATMSAIGEAQPRDDGKSAIRLSH